LKKGDLTGRINRWRKSLIRRFRLKGLRWKLFKVCDSRNRTLLPNLLQEWDDGSKLVLRIDGRGKKKPNAPGSSKWKHFDRADSRKNLRDFA
jgi:hypothetical protein